MTHAGASAHHAPGAAATSGMQTWFSADEWTALQTQDKQAARNIVCLMVGIFLTGLAMYLFIAYTVS
jgi:hypothetical protein